MESIFDKTTWRRINPWLLPIVLLAEISLVWSGPLNLLNAIVIAVGLEVLLLLTVAGRTLASVRRFRSVRVAGADRWAAALDALSETLPRPAARVLLIEARMWVCLLVVPFRRRLPAEAFTYGRSMRPMLIIAIVVVAVEMVIAELVLFAILGHSSWVWLMLALHLYGLVWLGGFLASFTVMPHVVTSRQIVLRDSVMNVMTIPRTAVTTARPATTPNVGRSGLKVDEQRRSAIFAHGDATVRLQLRSEAVLDVNGAEYRPVFDVLMVTADDAKAFVAEIERTAPDGLPRAEPEGGGDERE